MARAKAQKPTHEEFIFRIRDPSVSYSFALQSMQRYRDVFWEHKT